MRCLIKETGGHGEEHEKNNLGLPAAQAHCSHKRCYFPSAILEYHMVFIFDVCFQKGMLKSIFLIFYVSLNSTMESDDYMLSNILHLSVPKT